MLRRALRNVQIGATVGFYTVLAATRGYDVISVEPVPEAVIRILYSLAGNDIRAAEAGTDVATGTGTARKPVVYVYNNAASDSYWGMSASYIRDNPGASFVNTNSGGQAVTSGTAAVVAGWRACAHDRGVG